MKMIDILKMMFMATVLAVLYIHVQMNIYTMAYQGSARQKKIETLAEKNTHLKNDIVRLQSSDHIGRELLVKADKKYRFAGSDNVIEVASVEGHMPMPMAEAKEDAGFLAHVMTMAFAGSNTR